MLKPSYSELMNVLNQNSEENNEVTSRYIIVIAAAKRARQIIEGDEPMVKNKPGKPLSTAVDEILNNKIKIVPEGQGTVLLFNRNQPEDTNKKDKESDDLEYNNLNIQEDLEESEENLEESLEDIEIEY